RAAVEGDPLSAARQASETYGAVAVIKGEWSFIVAPDGSCFRFQGGGIGLATSGSGDTLAGIVGGLAARGADPLTAALWGVWRHGRSLARDPARRRSGAGDADDRRRAYRAHHRVGRLGDRIGGGGVGQGPREVDARAVARIGFDAGRDPVHHRYGFARPLARSA